MEQESEILQRLTRIETKLDVLSDHEKRIRFLERYAFMLIGVFALITLIVEVVIRK